MEEVIASARLANMACKVSVQVKPASVALDPTEYRNAAGGCDSPVLAEIAWLLFRRVIPGVTVSRSFR